ncbi:hypothetical protein TNCV_1589301 [Trichonephila clavipes]|uniref:Uncharacterized protein n=1 Tax=Trichonephila clavipes TaxID=2585209 RepID=A0A8X6RJK9_TRICX|nr:hypothetical protein TNCV_1589301 [Trichonephila clavipes]
MKLHPDRPTRKRGNNRTWTILDRVLGARAAGVHYRLFSVWTLVPVRLGKQLSDHSTVDEMASEAADCRHTYTMANCPQLSSTTTVGRRGSADGAGKTGKKRKEEGEREKERKELEKTRAGRFRKRRGESQSFLFRDADQESKTRMRKNALRTGPRQAVE